MRGPLLEPPEEAGSGVVRGEIEGELVGVTDTELVGGLVANVVFVKDFKVLELFTEDDPADEDDWEVEVDGPVGLTITVEVISSVTVRVVSGSSSSSGHFPESPGCWQTLTEQQPA